MKTICITGPREIPKDKSEYVKQSLRNEVEKAIADGFVSFFSCMLNDVDLDFAAFVVEKMKQHPELLLEAVIPYADRMKSKDKRFHELMRQCSSIKVISQERDRDCYFATNRYLTENSERVIAISADKPKSNTAQLIRMATAKGMDLRTIDISDSQTE